MLGDSCHFQKDFVTGFSWKTHPVLACRATGLVPIGIRISLIDRVGISAVLLRSKLDRARIGQFTHLPVPLLAQVAQKTARGAIFVAPWLVVSRGRHHAHER